MALTSSAGERPAPNRRPGNSRAGPAHRVNDIQSASLRRPAAAGYHVVRGQFDSGRANPSHLPLLRWRRGRDLFIPRRLRLVARRSVIMINLPLAGLACHRVYLPRVLSVASIVVFHHPFRIATRNGIMLVRTSHLQDTGRDRFKRAVFERAQRSCRLDDRARRGLALVPIALSAGEPARNSAPMAMVISGPVRFDRANMTSSDSDDDSVDRWPIATASA